MRLFVISRVIEMSSSRAMDLACRTYGDPHMPPLVLLMGLTTPAAAWPEPFIASLVQKGLYVVTPDNRDCGASPASQGDVTPRELFFSIVRYVLGGAVAAPYTLTDMADDTLRLMDQLGLAKAHVAGVSLGGMIAQCVALKAQHRTLSLACLSTASGNPRTGLGKFRALKAILASPDARMDPKEHLKKVMETIGTPGESYDDAFVEKVLRAASANPDAVAGGRRQVMALLAEGNRNARLRQLFVPTLVIHGLADPLLPPAAGKELASVIRGAEFLGIPGMGHDIPQKHWETIAGAMARHCYDAARKTRA